MLTLFRARDTSLSGAFLLKLRAVVIPIASLVLLGIAEFLLRKYASHSFLEWSENSFDWWWERHGQLMVEIGVMVAAVAVPLQVGSALHRRHKQLHRCIVDIRAAHWPGMRHLLVVIGVVGCGAVDGPNPERLDAAQQGDAPSAVDADHGVGLGLFSVPEVIPVLTSDTENGEDPTLTADELEIVFTSSRDGNANLWTSKRTSETTAWAKPTLVAELSTTSEERHPSISPDGLTIYFSSNRPGSIGSDDIFRSVRATRTTVWSTPAAVVELNTVADEQEFMIGADLLTGILDSSRDATAHIYLVTRTSTSSAWSSIRSLDELPGARSGAPADVGKAIYFVALADGARNLAVAVRADANANFGGLETLANVSSAAEESDPWISEDQRTIYFTRESTGQPRRLMRAAR